MPYFCSILPKAANLQNMNKGLIYCLSITSFGFVIAVLLVFTLYAKIAGIQNLDYLQQRFLTSTSISTYLKGELKGDTDSLPSTERNDVTTRKDITLKVTSNPAEAGAVKNSHSIITSSQETRIPTPPGTVTATVSSETVTTTRSSKADSATGRETVLRGWDSGSFCDELLQNTFSQLVPICETTHHSQQSAIMCKKNPKVVHIIKCSLTNVLIRPKKLFKGITSGDHIVNSEGIELLVTDSVGCESPNVDRVHGITQKDDHVRNMVEESVRRPTRLKSSDCQRWINETTFLYLGMNVHVYFEFLALYNAYKSILDEGNIGSYKVVRIAQHDFNFAFTDFEKLLFPGIEFVQNMTEESVCFKRLILPPRCYSSLLFVCKMKASILNQCYHCNGKGRPGIAFRSFRTHALKACSLNDSMSPITGYRNPKKIAVILRKPYKRYVGDQRTTFDRVLSNNDELLRELKARFAKANVISFHGEDLSVCEQMQMVHDADIFIGVHGAGLVHAWWLQDNALLVEIIPSDEIGNPTFKMLTTLIGINYNGYRIRQGSHRRISLDVKKFINALDTKIKNGI